LAVVQNARQAAAATSGATSGARVAAYLRGDAEQKPSGDKILERLAAPQPTTPTAVSPPVSQTLERVDEQKLAALAQPVESEGAITCVIFMASPPGELIGQLQVRYFLLILYFPIRVFVGLKGYEWKVRQLENRGYTYQGNVVATQQSAALARAKAGELEATRR